MTRTKCNHNCLIVLHATLHKNRATAFIHTCTQRLGSFWNGPWNTRDCGPSLVTRRDPISSQNEWRGARRREDSLQLCPLSRDMQRGYLVWTHTHTLRARAAGSGSRWASRAHQIIARAPPREAVCRGDGVRRATHNFSRWFVWWTNSMRTLTERWKENRASSM